MAHLVRCLQGIAAVENPTSGTDRLFVVQVQADEELDRNDIDFPEVLVAIIRQLARQLKERAEIHLKPGYFKDRWQRLKELALSEVEFDKLDLDAGMARISSTIRNSPEARKKVRAALEPDTDNWLKAANDIIGVAVLELQKQQFRGLVIIVDDLDKMITRPHEAAGCSTTEYLFVHRSAQLTVFQCHLVYTVPIGLAYSHHESTIKRLYGGDFPVVPLTKIETPPPHGKAYAKGIAKFREMTDARLNSAGATEDDLFESDKVRNDLIKLTGGQPTELMTLIREAMVTNGIPIGAQGIKRAATAASCGPIIGRCWRKHGKPAKSSGPKSTKSHSANFSKAGPCCSTGMMKSGMASIPPSKTSRLLLR
jgi:hypothetical protein